jgi:hypothetical protein
MNRRRPRQSEDLPDPHPVGTRNGVESRGSCEVARRNLSAARIRDLTEASRFRLGAISDSHVRFQGQAARLFLRG